jgi:hypothetical protein
MSETKKHEPEYTLHIFHATDPETRSAVTAFVVQTAREFISFKYEIPLDSAIEGETIHLTIHGLRVPENLVPGKGCAQGLILHRVLKGKYELLVTNVDGAINKFTLNLASRAIDVRASSKNPFIVYVNGKIRL